MGTLEVILAMVKMSGTIYKRAKIIVFFGSTKKYLKSLNGMYINLICETFSTEYKHSKLLACV